MRGIVRGLFACFAIISGIGGGAPAFAAMCNGNADALGVSRVIAVDPKEHTRIGTMQYEESLPLADHEVVITFDDGPLPHDTFRVLDELAAECVKADFFIVGAMAKAYPAAVRRVHAEGHVIGTHSFRHPFTFNKMNEEQAGAEIDEGIAAVAAALGDPKEVAPFFRVPGLLTSKATEQALASRGLMTWSADFPADDWKRISGAEVARRALARIEAKGRGILLLHDIHPRTVEALPIILRGLKARGYRIVQVVPASTEVAKTVTTPGQWVMRHAHQAPVQTAAAAPPSEAEPAGAKTDEKSPLILPTASAKGTGKDAGAGGGKQRHHALRRKLRAASARPVIAPAPPIIEPATPVPTRAAYNGLIGTIEHALFGR